MGCRDAPPSGEGNLPPSDHKDRFWASLFLTALLLLVMAAGLVLSLYA